MEKEINSFADYPDFFRILKTISFSYKSFSNWVFTNMLIYTHAILFLENQLIQKFLRLKPEFNWTELMIKEELFTQDVALMLGDTEIYLLAVEYNIQCDIVINPGRYLTHFANAFAFQKDFALKEIIDYQLLKFKQTGLLKKLANKYFRQIPRDCEPKIKELSFKATFVPFALLASGVLIAFCSLLVEKITFVLFLRRG